MQSAFEAVTGCNLRNGTTAADYHCVVNSILTLTQFACPITGTNTAPQTHSRHQVFYRLLLIYHPALHVNLMEEQKDIAGAAEPNYKVCLYRQNHNPVS